jgi:hypothetical protein
VTINLVPGTATWDEARGFKDLEFFDPSNLHGFNALARKPFIQCGCGAYTTGR